MRPAHRLPRNGVSALLAVGLFLGWPGHGWSQSIAATLPAAGNAVAINRATNKIYAASGDKTGVVTVIDGKTHTIITSVPAGPRPCAVAINDGTNKIYVTNSGGLYHGEIFLGNGSITVIDGVTNATTTVVDPNAKFPCALAVNPSTNKTYVANIGSGNVTVIDGATNATTTVTEPNAGGLQLHNAVAVNPTTNKIYVANGESYSGSTGNVTIIDGADNSATTINDPRAVDPAGVAVNAVTNRVYVANNGDGGANHGNVTVIDGDTNAITTVADPNALLPTSVALNSVTNKVYVTNAGGNVTVIDGATNSTITVTDPNSAPLSGIGALRSVAGAVNETTNTVYVANEGCDGGPFLCAPGSDQGSITVIDGSTNSVTTIINLSGKDPDAVAANPSTDEIYVANFISGNLTVLAGGGTATNHTLAVVLSGSGTVTASPGGIDCGGGGACEGSYALGTAVKLTASAASGSYFSRWSGPCAGTNSCDLAINQDQFVIATFSSPVVVPGVVGLTQTAATTAITGAGLVLGTVTQQLSNIPVGSVVSESPAVGTSVAPGSAVNLVVSSGDPKPVGNSGGGGGMEVLTLAALLGSLLVGLEIPKRRRRNETQNVHHT